MVQEPETPKSDLILTFCQDFIFRYHNSWPPDEQTLAREFVSYFRSFWFVTIGEIEKFCLATGIELTQKNITHDLLAVNFSFNGKRGIELDDRPQNLPIQTHTALHEIRELLEYTFCDLGSPITGRSEIEIRANEFASLVMISRIEREFAGLIETAVEIRPGFLKIGAFALLGAAAFAVIAQACLGPTYPHLPSQSSDSQPRERYLT